MANTASAMDIWRRLFQGWPTDVPRRGVIVTVQNEQIPFDGFADGPQLLFIDRSTPDSLGGRKIILPYENIAALKLIDVVKAKSFAALGFASGGKP